MNLKIKKVDEKGRLFLGKGYERRYVSLLEIDGLTVVIPIDTEIETIFDRIDKRLEEISISESELSALLDNTRRELFKELY